MDVSIKLRSDVAAAISAGEDVPAVDRTLDQLGVILQPVHPGHRDPELQTYYRVEAPDEQTARRLSEELAGLDEVEAAYVKPPDELP